MRPFTLIELLVVIFVIAILSSILLPALMTAKNSAKRVQCLGKIKGIGSYVQMYLGDRDYIPPTSYLGQNWNPGICPFRPSVSHNQYFWACLLGLYTDRGRDFKDPASPFVRKDVDMCKATGHYCGVGGTRGFYKPTSIKSISSKIFIVCAGVEIYTDTFQKNQDKGNVSSYFPGTALAVTPENLSGKLSVMTGVEGGKMKQDFINGRHGQYTNALYLDGHAASLPAKEIMDICRMGSGKGPFNWLRD